jgi:hypothetical protein
MACEAASPPCLAHGLRLSIRLQELPRFPVSNIAASAATKHTDVEGDSHSVPRCSPDGQLVCRFAADVVAVEPSAWRAGHDDLADLR